MKGFFQAKITTPLMIIKTAKITEKNVLFPAVIKIPIKNL
jgi:hypothetical protein